MKSWLTRTLIGVFGASVLFGSLAACSHRPHYGYGGHAMSEEDAAKMKTKMIEKVGSRLDLDDGPVARGVGHALSAGANLYINRNVRMMVTYTDSHVDFPALATNVKSSVGVSRLQINF